MQMESPPPQAAQQQPAAAKVYYFDGASYQPVVDVLVQYTGIIFGEVQKGEQLSHEKLGIILNFYLQTCVRKGFAPEEQTNEKGTCTHLFTKGLKAGHTCGKPAGYRGIDGRLKCSSHKSSKPAKETAGAPAAVDSAGAAGQVFSYAANQGKGKVAPQSLVSIQAAIARQVEPVKLDLAQAPAPDGRIFNPLTKIVFEQRGAENNNWVAVGLIDGPNTVKLSLNEVSVCYGNGWRWDTNCVDDEAAKSMGHPLVIGGDHPLVSSTDANSLISSKIGSILDNNRK